MVARANSHGSAVVTPCGRSRRPAPAYSLVVEKLVLMRGPSSPPSTVRHHDARRGAARGTEDPAAGMGRRAGEIETAHRRTVTRQLGQRSVGEHRIETHLDVHDVASQQTELVLQILRRLHMAVLDR